MARGGKRPGAGRKAGARNKRTAEMIRKAKETGMLPHEILCAVAQGKNILGAKPTREERIDAAKAAAPFYAPRLGAIVAKINQPGNPWDEILGLVDGKSRGLPSGSAPAGAGRSGKSGG